MILQAGYTDHEAVRHVFSRGQARLFQKPFDIAAPAREIRDAPAES